MNLEDIIPFERNLESFIAESNRIEGIMRPPRASEIEAHRTFLELKRPSVPALERFVLKIAGAQLRKRRGMNVRVGKHYPPTGGPELKADLKHLLDHGLHDTVAGKAWTPYRVHQRYEELHPFMDGNGRSGRVLWAWQRLKIGRDPFALGFLHSWYYESLDASR